MIEVVNTYNSPEILSYEEFITYLCLLSIVTLNRKEFKTKILDNHDVI